LQDAVRIGLIFSMFGRAQLESGFLSGGMAIVGLLNLFVAFHNE
jgi:hypothetical protein